jgi:CHRD domain
VLLIRQTVDLNRRKTEMTPLARTLAGMAVAATLAATPAFAEMMSLKADLKGASEVPPVTSPGTGTVTATYDTASKKLSWKGTVSGLSGNATAAHFHGPAEPGKNAGVMVPAPGVTTGPFEGSATLTDDQARAVLAGQTYFNIHTAANPNGEVRGQVVKGQ